MVDRFWRKVDRGGADECWRWLGGIASGYGTFRVGAHKVGAHRVSYEMAHGPIAEGLVIDHLCRNTACVNPSHLEAVTQATNLRRAPSSWPARNAAKSECVNGHAFTDENTAIVNGWRRCRTCQREQARARRAS